MLLQLFKKKEPYTTFWKWFVKNESYINNNFETNKESILDELNNKLKEIDTNLTFEISHSNGEQHREIIISADGIAESFDHVINLCNAAPSITNWTIIAFRPRMNSNGIEIKMGEIVLGYDDIYFTYESNGHYIDLKIYMKYEEEDRNQYINMYFILLDSLIGEFDAVSKIGNTEFFSLENSDDPALQRFIELIDIIDSL
ncbi:hypothetical protein [Paenibacillus glycanilyticus]|uniref:Uncharacterized protein n=1 Tax=Paenibacillus glycanilyticus TaxID=126569 RepID=A0ABQ6GHS7_9BACL|nr:hypothetical protein [Paenibacillus glycanilyticus]GLX70494.1 hypothetical protein MU1_48400 [Paenibacillus glycanilyticus]